MAKNTIYETHARAWFKSIVWRVLGIVILALISWIVTHDWKEVGVITIIFHTIRVLLYYFHERVWERIEWGRINTHPLADIPVKKDLSLKDKEKVKECLRNLNYID